MKHFTRLLMLVGFLFLLPLSISPALAQTTSDFDRADLFLGYQHKNIDSDNFSGANISVTGNFHRYLGAEFNFGYAKGPQRPIFGRPSDVDYLGGLRVKDNGKTAGKIRPFGHLLVGINQARFLGVNYNEFATLVGGGLDISISERVAIRSFQADYQRLYDVSSGASRFKVAFGVLIK